MGGAARRKEPVPQTAFALNDLFCYIGHRLQNQFLEQWLSQTKQKLCLVSYLQFDATGSSDNHSPGPRQSRKSEPQC